MQPQIHNEAELIGRQCLPPPTENPVSKIPRTGNRRYAMQSFACIFCAAAALLVLFVCALDKIDEIRERGLLEYLSEEVLKTNGGNQSLGDLMSAAAFGHGDTRTDIEAAKTDIPAQGAADSAADFLHTKRTDRRRNLSGKRRT